MSPLWDRTRRDVGPGPPFFDFTGLLSAQSFERLSEEHVRGGCNLVSTRHTVVVWCRLHYQTVHVLIHYSVTVRVSVQVVDRTPLVQHSSGYVS